MKILEVFLVIADVSVVKGNGHTKGIILKYVRCREDGCRVRSWNLTYPEKVFLKAQAFTIDRKCVLDAPRIYFLFRNNIMTGSNKNQHNEYPTFCHRSNLINLM